MEGLHLNIHVVIPFRRRTRTEPELVSCRTTGKPRGKEQATYPSEFQSMRRSMRSLLGYRDIVQLENFGIEVRGL